MYDDKGSDMKAMNVVSNIERKSLTLSELVDEKRGA